MFEGHDTTATGITWAIQMLGNHQDLQEKVFLEIQKVCGDDSLDVTLDQLSQLKYLECFIKETLRLYPSVPIIARRFGTDGNIDGYFVPKNTQILINIYLIHRDPEHWNDPEVFNPDRLIVVFFFKLKKIVFFLDFYQKIIKDAIHMHIFHSLLVIVIALVKGLR